MYYMRKYGCRYKRSRLRRDVHTCSGSQPTSLRADTQSKVYVTFLENVLANFISNAFFTI